jgi:predicted RNase H-like HicB family nuclease
MNIESISTPKPLTVNFTVTLTAMVYAEPEAGGFSAEVPALPGCYTQGETLEEIRARVKEAAQGWLDSLHEEATSIPCV